MGLLKFFRVKKKSKVADKKTQFGDCNVEPGFGATKFRWSEIEGFTKNFSTVVGSGGFSNVYFARMGAAAAATAAVKILGSSERLNRMFRQELDILLQLRHRNIVSFIGYCDERDEGALVFEYVPNGNLQEKLHGGANGRPPYAAAAVLPWKIRLLIAFQLALAIEYLHEKCSLQIVHGDIKSSNILLDGGLNCKLCDFGSAKMGFSSAVANPSPSPTSPFRAKQLMMGSPGYTDPQYLRTGIASKKNDVYSFGVVILELVTGKEAFCSEKGQILTSILAPAISDGGGIKPSAVKELVDPRLRGDFDVGEAGALLSIAAACVSQPPAPRPGIGGVLQMMREKIGPVGDGVLGEKRGGKNYWMGGDGKMCKYVKGLGSFLESER